MHPTTKRLIQGTPILGSLWASRDQALQDLAAQQISLEEHQRSLRDHQEALARTEQSLIEHQAALTDVQRAFAEYRAMVEGPGKQLNHNSDGLITFQKSLDFLTDPRFRRAYDKGIQSGHTLGPTVNADLGIEYRVHILLWAAHHAMNLDGDFVECGVNTGICSLAICDYLDWNAHDKEFWLFDTYCGIPDRMITDQERMLGRTEHNDRAYFDCYEIVQNNFRPYSGMHIVRGEVPATLTQFTGQKVAYLHIDMNIVEPEIAAIEFFWDKVATSGIIVLDDYGWADYRPQKVAMDDFAKRKGIMIATLPTGQGLIVK